MRLSRQATDITAITLGKMKTMKIFRLFRVMSKLILCKFYVLCFSINYKSLHFLLTISSTNFKVASADPFRGVSLHTFLFIFSKESDNSIALYSNKV